MIRLNILNKKIQRNSYISRSKKVSLALKKILSREFIGVIDIGAGHRYLPILLNFDGIAKIAMVDPNKSLDWSYNNFKKLIKYPKNLYKFNFGISNKTTKIKYYIANTLTGSTFVNIFKIAKKKKNKLDENYFGKQNTTMQQVYSFKDFSKFFFKYNIDVIKIDVEGLEDKIVSSIMNCANPFLIEIEMNLNSEIYPNSFDKINLLLKKNKYKMLTGYPVYTRSKNSLKNQPYILGDYDNPALRAPIEQFECIYVREKKKYNLKEVTILLGYGFLHEVQKIIRLSKINFTQKKLNLINIFIKNFF